MAYGPPLPQPPDFGFLGGQKIQQTEVRLPRVEPTGQEFRVPDMVSVRFGKGDKNTVGALLRAASGQDSGLTGVSSTYAAKLLESWGYPTNPDAWTGDQWDAALKANAAVDPMAAMSGLLGGY